MPAEVFRRATKLMEANVADDIVALDPEMGLCFSFNEVAADVWRFLSAPRSFEELKAHLLARYDVDESECSAQLRELLSDMCFQGLIKGDSKSV